MLVPQATVRGDSVHALQLFFSVGAGLVLALTAVEMMVQTVGSYPLPPIARAVVDSAAHAVVAGLVWLAATLITTGLANQVSSLLAITPLKETVVALICGAAVDCDHFLAAGSLRLASATSLATRPLAHCLWAVPPAAALAGLLTKQVRSSLLVTSAIFSHQLRDAIRRGLWLWPVRAELGSTAPLSWPVYLTAQTGLACTLGLLATYIIRNRAQHKLGVRCDDVVVL